jgi:hypothetical protein
VLSFIPKTWKIWGRKQPFPVSSDYTGTHLQGLRIPREYSVHTARDLAEIRNPYLPHTLLTLSLCQSRILGHIRRMWEMIYSVYIKSGNTLNYLLHKNYKLYRHHIRVILKRNSESLYVPHTWTWRCPSDGSDVLQKGTDVSWSGLHDRQMSLRVIFFYGDTLKIWCMYRLVHVM